MARTARTSAEPTMRAAYFEALRTIRVGGASVPVPMPGEVRLEVRFCGICGSDLSLYTTGALAGPDVVLGHEISAVVDLDPSDAWDRGARVAPYPGGHGCGRCVWCLDGKPRYCIDPPPRHGGGFARYLVVPADDLIGVPDGVDDRAAALAEPLGVALRGIETAEPRPGDVAYVSGLGSIGLLVVAGLVAAGCRVVGADPREERRAAGLAQGCEQVFDPTTEDPFFRTLAVDARGPRVAFECSGAPDALQQTIDACGNGGVVGILGIPMAPVFLLRMTLKELRAFSIQGPTPDAMRRALDLLRDRPRIADIVTGTVSLEDAPQAFERLAGGDGGIKVLVDPRPTQA